MLDKKRRYNANSLPPLARGRLIRHMACAESQLRVILRADFAECYAEKGEYEKRKKRLAAIYMAIDSTAHNLANLKIMLRDALNEEP